jgi:hypothetical protein
MPEVNKAEAIRDAIAALGGDPKPKMVVEHLHEKGIEVSAGYVSMEKSKIKKAAESAVTRSPVARVRAAAEPATTAEPAAAPSRVAARSMVDLILTVKQLILDCGGKEELKMLIDAL